MLDKDRDGFLNDAELRAAMKEIGEPLTDEELGAMIRAGDQDKDGKIGFDDYFKMMTVNVTRSRTPASAM